MSAAFPHDCFDSSAAELPTRVVPIGDVIDLLPIPHAPEVVERYREDMLAQRRFPPVSVLPVGRWLLLADGHKRLTAYRSLSPSTILVEVWTLRRWLADPDRVKPGVKMPKFNFTDEQLKELVAYFETLK